MKAIFLCTSQGLNVLLGRKDINREGLYRYRDSCVQGSCHSSTLYVLYVQVVLASAIDPSVDVRSILTKMRLLMRRHPPLLRLPLWCPT